MMTNNDSKKIIKKKKHLKNKQEKAASSLVQLLIGPHTPDPRRMIMGGIPKVLERNAEEETRIWM